jgi:hypothetical protein
LESPDFFFARPNGADVVADYGEPFRSNDRRLASKSICEKVGGGGDLLQLPDPLVRADLELRCTCYVAARNAEHAIGVAYDPEKTQGRSLVRGILG